MYHRLSAVATTGVVGTALTDLGTAPTKWAATLEASTVFVPAANAFVFNPIDDKAITIPTTSLGGPYGTTFAFWWRHDIGAREPRAAP